MHFDKPRLSRPKKSFSMIAAQLEPSHGDVSVHGATRSSRSTAPDIRPRGDEPAAERGPRRALPLRPSPRRRDRLDAAAAHRRPAAARAPRPHDACARPAAPAGRARAARARELHRPSRRRLWGRQRRTRRQPARNADAPARREPPWMQQRDQHPHAGVRGAELHAPLWHEYLSGEARGGHRWNVGGRRFDHRTHRTSTTTLSRVASITPRQ